MVFYADRGGLVETGEGCDFSTRFHSADPPTTQWPTKEEKTCDSKETTTVLGSAPSSSAAAENYCCAGSSAGILCPDVFLGPEGRCERPATATKSAIIKGIADFETTVGRIA